jgi:hypothetical protein
MDDRYLDGSGWEAEAGYARAARLGGRIAVSGTTAEGVGTYAPDRERAGPFIKRWQATPPESIAIAVSDPEGSGVLTWWLIETRGPSGDRRASILSLGVSDDGRRNARVERLGTSVFSRAGNVDSMTPAARKALLCDKVDPILEREPRHREIVPGDGIYAAKLIGWLEVVT